MGRAMTEWMMVYHIKGNFGRGKLGKSQAKLHLVKQTLAKLSQTPTAISDATILLVKLWRICSKSPYLPKFPCQSFPLYGSSVHPGYQTCHDQNYLHSTFYVWLSVLISSTFSTLETSCQTHI